VGGIGHTGESVMNGVAEDDRAVTPRVAGERIESALAALRAAHACGEMAWLKPEDLQWLMAVAVKTYCAKRVAGEDFPLLSDAPDPVTATEIMTVASQLLKAGNLQAFELGMWQSWTRD
jgi:hypothetical protein